LLAKKETFVSFGRKEKRPLLGEFFTLFPEKLCFEFSTPPTLLAEQLKTNSHQGFKKNQDNNTVRIRL